MEEDPFVNEHDDEISFGWFEDVTSFGHCRALSHSDGNMLMLIIFLRSIELYESKKDPLEPRILWISNWDSDNMWSDRAVFLRGAVDAGRKTCKKKSLLAAGSRKLEEAGFLSWAKDTNVFS